jgi:hypothetical protein
VVKDDFDVLTFFARSPSLDRRRVDSAITVNAALAYSIAGAGNDTLASGLNDLAWVGSVIASFPAAMLIMAGSFGLWRAGIISNALFGAGVAAVVLFLFRGTTWASDGIWAPDGAYSRLIAPIIGLSWIGGLQRAPLRPRSLQRARAPDRAAVPVP